MLLSQVLRVHFCLSPEFSAFLKQTIEAPDADKKTAWAANFGLGFHVPFNRVVPFAEYHFTTGKLEEHVLSGGIFYIFKKEESEH